MLLKGYLALLGKQVSLISHLFPRHSRSAAIVLTSSWMFSDLFNLFKAKKAELLLSFMPSIPVPLMEDIDILNI